MRRVAAAAVLGAFAIAGCANQQDAYEPPFQRRPLSIEEPAELRSFVKMSDAAAPAHFMRDISRTLEGGAWRWTGKYPTLMFAAPKKRPVTFVAELTVPEITFKDTGPVVIAISVNSHRIATEAFNTPGSRRIEKPVPDAWLRAKRENVVSMEIDKPWVSPTDGVKLGFVLTSIGFPE